LFEKVDFRANFLPKDIIPEGIKNRPVLTGKKESACTLGKKGVRKGYYFFEKERFQAYFHIFSKKSN